MSFSGLYKFRNMMIDYTNKLALKSVIFNIIVEPFVRIKRLSVKLNQFVHTIFICNYFLIISIIAFAYNSFNLAGEEFVIVQKKVI